MNLYTVQMGDTLYRIAKRFGTTPRRIAEDNGLSESSSLVVGQSLVITKPLQTYRVETGDTLYTVAQRFGVSIGQLWRSNPSLGGRTELVRGQILTVVPEPPMYDRPITTNTYVYPSVNRDLLRGILPYLTYLTVFGYRVEEDGGLEEIDDEEIVELARQYGTAPIMLVSTLNERGQFSSDLAASILSDPNKMEMLTEQIARIVTERRYYGVDVDFEYVPKEYADEYALLVRMIRDRMNAMGRIAVVSLAPKTSAEQSGILYEAHDYGALGEAADRSFLMTYEWGYRYSPPMAVSPVDQVRRVVEYGVSEIPAERVVMGVPNYGYDWALPYERGTTRAQSLGNQEAVELARAKRAAISYDEQSAAPFFRYYDRQNGRDTEHEVWFEDGRSIRALLDVVEEYGLDGIGIWNGMRPFTGMWQVIANTNPIRKVWG